MRTLSLAVLASLMLIAAGRVEGQQIRLTIAGLPLTKPSTPVTDFDAGSAIYGAMSFEVDVRSNGPQKVTTVSVRCATPCPATGTLSLARVQFLSNTDSDWRQLTTSYQAVQSRNATRNVLNDPWSGTITWRYLLDWVATPPTAASRFNLQFQLTVAAP